MNNSYRLLLSALFGLIGTSFGVSLFWYSVFRKEEPSTLTIVTLSILTVLWWYKADMMKRSYDEHNHEE